MFGLQTQCRKIKYSRGFLINKDPDIEGFPEDCNINNLRVHYKLKTVNKCYKFPDMINMMVEDSVRQILRRPIGTIKSILNEIYCNGQKGVLDFPFGEFIRRFSLAQMKMNTVHRILDIKITYEDKLLFSCKWEDL